MDGSMEEAKFNREETAEPTSHQNTREFGNFGVDALGFFLPDDLLIDSYNVWKRRTRETKFYVVVDAESQQFERWSMPLQKLYETCERTILTWMQTFWLHAR
uniref:Uncharacterized protein n=1 Tax=Caenorhabditis japonica TaxID=281687 RepID=A0A8R1IMD3_CAEJA